MSSNNEKNHWSPKELSANGGTYKSSEDKFSNPKYVCVLVSSTERAELAGRLEVTEQQVSVGLRSMNSR